MSFRIRSFLIQSSIQIRLTIQSLNMRDKETKEMNETNSSKNNKRTEKQKN